MMSSMSLNETKKFFRFWDSFDSWRVFSQYDEYDTTEAGDRYERRYMEKENKGTQKKYLKEERGRLFKLVELARKHNPLLIKEEADIEAEKQRVKAERSAVRDKQRLMQENTKKLAADKIEAAAQAVKDE